MTTRSRFSRRSFVLGAAVVAGTALVAACSQPAPPTAAPAAQPAATPASAGAAKPATEPAKPAAAAPAAAPTPVPGATAFAKPGLKTIEFWSGWGGLTGINAIRSMINQFNEKTATFQANSLIVPDVAAKLLTAIAGGTAPDVAVGGGVPYAELWSRAAALPLDDYLKASKVIKQEDFFESNWKRARWKGVTYGIPAIEAFVILGLGWNEDLLTKAGLSSEQPPQTFDELYQWHTKLTTFDDAKNLRQLGFDPMDAVGGGIYYWTFAHGVQYWDAAGLKYNLDNPETVEALATIKKFYDYVGAEKVDGFRKSYGQWTQSPTAAFPSGVSAMIINGYWEPGELTKSAAGKKFGHTWVPVSNKKKGAKLQAAGGHFTVQPKGTKNRDEAFQLQEHITTDEAITTVFQQTGWIGAKKSYLAKMDPKVYPGLDFYVRSTKEATELGDSPMDPLASFTGTTWAQTVDKVKFGDRKPEEAAKDMQKALTDELKKRNIL